MLPDFKTLKCSTMTVVIKTNMVFDLKHIYQKFSEFSTTRKKKAIPLKSKIVVNKPNIYQKGTISYVKYNDMYLGEKIIKSKKKGTDFTNQITINIHTDHNIINVMIFSNGKMKLAGCIDDNDTKFVIDTIYDYISPCLIKHESLSKECKICSNSTSRIINNHIGIITEPIFIFTNEMINITFSFPDIVDDDFVINKLKLNQLLQKNDYCTSSFEQTLPSYTDVKFQYYDTFRFGKRYLYKSNKIINERIDIIKKDKIPSTCIMVFPQRIVMSACGIDYNILENHYIKFKNIIEENLPNTIYSSCKYKLLAYILAINFSKYYRMANIIQDNKEITDKEMSIDQDELLKYINYVIDKKKIIDLISKHPIEILNITPENFFNSDNYNLLKERKGKNITLLNRPNLTKLALVISNTICYEVFHFLKWLKLDIYNEIINCMS